MDVALTTKPRTVTPTASSSAARICAASAPSPISRPQDPVVSAVQASFWDALRLAGVRASKPGFGRLFEH
jgi:hypothetical protein